jgi:arylsulfatase A-like enzyme
MRWPGVVPAGREVSQVAVTMDLAPTLLSASGVRGGRLDGIDLMPFLTGTQAPAKRTLFWRYKRAQNVRRAVRHGDWKYADDNGAKGLYDIGADPQEENDLLKSRPDLARDLEARLARWEKDVESPRLKGFRAGG